MIANRSRFLLIHGINVARWTARWELQPFTHPCGVCEQPLTTSIPFACGTLRGLIAPRCACGNPNPPYCIVRDPRFGDLFTGAEA